MSEIKLKPCPFCGNPAMILQGTDGGEPYLYVVCGCCAVRTPFFYCDEEDTLSGVKEIVAKAWNRRVKE